MKTIQMMVQTAGLHPRQYLIHPIHTSFTCMIHYAGELTDSRRRGGGTLGMITSTKSKQKIDNFQQLLESTSPLPTELDGISRHFPEEDASYVSE